MLNLPDDLYEDYSQLALTSSFNSSMASTSAAPPPTTVVSYPSLAMIKCWINDLQSDNPIMSDFALNNLVKHRNDVEMLPKMIWDFPGAVAMLLSEVTRASVQITGHISLRSFPPLNPNRIYNIVLLFQMIAYRPETRGDFLKAKMPHYFYPLMDMGPVDKQYESLRLAALGVIGHLLKPPQEEAAIRFVMETGAFGYCAKPIEFGCTDSKTLAVFILSKIASTADGLKYCCVLGDRYFVIDGLLKKLLLYLTTMAIPSSSLFSLVVSCYHKLSQKNRVRNGLRRYPPILLFNGTFARLLAQDPVAHDYFKELTEAMNSRNNEAAERVLSKRNIENANRDDTA